MALIYFNGFDYLTDAQLTAVGINGNGIGTGGRGGGNLLYGYNWDVPWTLSGVIPTMTDIIFGGALKVSSYFGYPLMWFQNGTSTQVQVVLDINGRLYANGYTGSTICSTETALLLNQWHYLEFKIVFHSSAGSFVARLNGVEIMSVSGVNTGTSINRIVGTAGGTVTPHGWDDMYVCDSSGSAPYNDFLGDVSCQVLLPSGNGNSSQWVGSDGNSVDNYAMVDENPPNGDTDYVKSSTVGDKDLYDYGSIAATSGTVYAVKPLLYARKDDAGTRKIVSVARLSGGTEEDGPEQSIGETYGYWSDIRTTKPGGGSWSISDVNNAQFGIKVTV